MKNNFLQILILLSIPFSGVFAGHGQSGYFRITTDGSTTVQMDYYYFQQAWLSPPVGFQICFSDGWCTIIEDYEEVDSVQYNYLRYRYTLSHDLGEYGLHKVHTTQPNIPGGILNVDFPNSATVPFHTETEFLLQEGMFNTSPFLHELPFVFPEVEVPITYHPIPIDTEGHRLEYKLITPLQGDGWIVPNYLFPDEVDPGIENNYQFDANTGLSRWSSPQRTGDYLVAFRIEEYDELGLFLSSTILPVYFKVTEIGHIMPTITPDSLTITVPNLPADIVLNIEANATDQLVLFEGYSELLENGAATFTASPDFEFGPVVEQFIVSAGVDLARSYPYYLILRAGDDYSAEQSGVVFEVVKLGLGDLLSTSGPLASTIELGVFPNPTTDFLEISWNKDLTKGAGLEVWQTDGRMVFHQPLDTGQRALELPVSSWTAGTYWLVIRSSEGWLSQPFVKQ